MSTLNYGKEYRNQKENHTMKHHKYKLFFMIALSLLPFVAVLLISRMNLGSYIVFGYLPYVLFLLCPVLYFIILSLKKDNDGDEE